MRSPDHQGICAEVGAFHYAAADALLSAARPLIVALDQIQDRQNLGAICRSAECAGATGVVIGERRSAEVTPAVCKASAGAVEHLPIAQVRNIADFLGQAKAPGSGAMAPTVTRRWRMTRSTSRAPSCSCSVPRGAACARVSLRHATCSFPSRFAAESSH